MKIHYVSVIGIVVSSLALVLGLGACGSDEPDPTATTAPTPTTVAPTPEATATGMMAEPTPEATATGMMAEPTPEATATGMMAEPTPAATTPTTTTAAPAPTETGALTPDDAVVLAQYAADHAGGPGAIFVGDPTHLIGPPPHEGLMFQVPEALYTQLSTVALVGSPELGIPGHMFIYDSDYYVELIQKANLTNPTELTSSGESIEIQHTCIDRNLPTCVLIQSYWAPNLAKRTNGQVNLSVVSFVELGLSGPETLDQVSSGTLDMVNIYTGYVAGVLPALEIQSLWGMSSDWESTYSIVTDLYPDIDRMILEATEGSHVLNRNWFAGSDQWFFGNKPLVTLEDFQGVKIRSHGAAMSDFITGMGGEPVFLDVAEVYTALERGNVDASANSALLAVPDRLFEVADYMSGPVIGFGYTNNVINKDVWDSIPTDLQQIIIEEGAKAELEALRLAPFQNIVAVQLNQQLGLQYELFSEEITNHIHTVVMPEHVIPGWLRRLGYPGRNADVVALANDKLAPYMGLFIAEDGSIEQVPITKGSRAQ
ncbi:MAG: TRAP transporter substrate-binding protein DctP [Dehalococcoidia bacterium]|nr:TRAP transporter substrate-binding protein DctP [Dehalococcoidia bacterium]